MSSGAVINYLVFHGTGYELTGDTLNVTVFSNNSNSSSSFTNPVTTKLSLSGGFVSESVASSLKDSTVDGNGATITGNIHFSGTPVFANGASGISSGQTYQNATTTQSGLMSASDKTKLNNLASITSAGSNINIANGQISATYQNATTTQSGLMSAQDKASLDNVVSQSTFTQSDIDYIVNGNNS